MGKVDSAWFLVCQGANEWFPEICVKSYKHFQVLWIKVLYPFQSTQKAKFLFPFQSTQRAKLDYISKACTCLWIMSYLVCDKVWLHLQFLQLIPHLVVTVITTCSVACHSCCFVSLRVPLKGRTPYFEYYWLAGCSLHRPFSGPVWKQDQKPRGPCCVNFLRNLFGPEKKMGINNLKN